MNVRTIAVLAAIMMVAAGAIVAVSSDDTSAADDNVMNADVVVLRPSGSIYTGTLTRVVNTDNYASYNPEVIWSAVATDAGTNSGAGWTNMSVLSGTPVTVSDVSVAVEKSSVGTKGVAGYKFTFSTGSTLEYQKYIGLKCEITITVPDVIAGATGTATYNMYYKVILTTDGTYVMTLTEMTATYGVPIKQQINPSAGIDNISNYVWYAEGLPNGLAMQIDGFVSGIPLETGTFEDIKVTAMKKDGSETKTASLKIVVSPSGNPSEHTNFEYTISGADNVSSAGEKLTNPTLVIATQGNVVKMNTKVGNPAADSDVSKVVVIQNGKVVDDGLKSVATGEYIIPTDGTGSYIVKITINDDQNGGNPDEVMFSLVVVSEFKDISAGIIAVGN